MKLARSDLRFLAVPLLFAALSVWMTGVRGPYDLGLNLDPEYQYLLNMVSLATGSPSAYVDHPGTPLQIIGAGVVLARWLVTAPWHGFAPLADVVLGNSVLYLRTVNVVLVLLLVVVAFFAGRRVYHCSGSLGATLALQITPLVYLTAVEALPRVAPELVEVIVGLALAIPLAPLLVGDAPERAAANPRLALWAGALIGAGIATKANFFTLGLLVFLFAGWRQWARFTAACGATLAVLLLPIATEWRQFIAWYLNMATHTGHYGKGQAGLPTLAAYRASLVQVYENEPFVFYFAALYLLVLVAVLIGARQLGRGRASLYRKALVLAPLIIALHALITAKHFNYHYVLPAAMLTALINGMLVYLLETTRFAKHWKTVVVAAALLVGYEGLRGNYFRIAWYDGWKSEYKQQIAAVTRERAKLGDCRVAGFFRSSAPGFALSIGNVMSACRHQAALERLDPGGFQYSTFEHKFQRWDCGSADQEVRRLLEQGACVVLQGEVVNRDQVIGFTLEPVYVPRKLVHGSEGLYRVLLPESEPAAPGV